jgi:hypothetical protein
MPWRTVAFGLGSSSWSRPQDGREAFFAGAASVGALTHYTASAHAGSAR